MDRLEFVFVPVVNPDGYEVLVGLNTHSSVDNLPSTVHLD